MFKYFICSILCFFLFNLTAQNNTSYWQQSADYVMDIDMDIKTNRYQGRQQLTYTNNAPDTLNQVFYHLYFNAFQPGSEMDARSLSLPDPDRRVGDRISKLNQDEIGFIRVRSLKYNNSTVDFNIAGTILQVKLPTPILPGQRVVFEMDFEAQVPLQIRRSGRDNKEDVRYSMSQWFPKIAEYDYEGWHDHPYIAREFHGVWGNYDVTIHIDKDYLVAGSGYLQNPENIGFGYDAPNSKPKKIKDKKRSWRFIAPNVHDFTWPADPEYIHDVYEGPNDVKLHFVYKNNPEIEENWKKLQALTADLMRYFNEHIGPYPWKQYSVIQGGDGGMEYAMCTLITGERSFESLLGVTAHELAHAWFQHLLATNESLHEWMDEGFTTYISELAVDHVLNKNSENPFERTYRSYFMLAESGRELPQTTHADHYSTNFAYGLSAYSKGAVFLNQLNYIIGKENTAKTLKNFYEAWKFKHPNPNDFIRVAEKTSGLQLSWYLNEWTQTTHQIDYAINSVKRDSNKTSISLERIGEMPMPIDLIITDTQGKQTYFYIPLQRLRGHKPSPFPNLQNITLEAWPWAYPTYEFSIDIPYESIQSIEIDPSKTMADVTSENNRYVKP
ncbi:MAG: M1 family metallopeptidase [Flavobacteriaceae bacterium]|nr:M1 family metallopeptidase [Flavobacteriaceae bacterium]